MDKKAKEDTKKKQQPEEAFDYLKSISEYKDNDEDPHTSTPVMGRGKT